MHINDLTLNRKKAPAFKHLAIAATAVLAPTAVYAQDDPWSFEATVASEYVSKGAGRSDGEPHLAVQAQRTMAGDLYAGGWAGTLGSPLDADGEAHLYLGWRPKAGDWNFDFRTMVKILAGARSGEQDSQFEMRADAARQLGATRLRLRAEHAPNGYGAARGSTWVEAQIVRPLSQRWSLTGSLGRREQAVGRDYTGWSAGVQRRLPAGATLDLRWLQTDAENAGREYEGRAFAAITARF